MFQCNFTFAEVFMSGLPMKTETVSKRTLQNGHPQFRVSSPSHPKSSQVIPSRPKSFLVIPNPPSMSQRFSSTWIKATERHVKRGARISEMCCKKTPHDSSGLEPQASRSFHNACLHAKQYRREIEEDLCSLKS